MPKMPPGVINMSQVLQRQMDQELELVEGKGGGAVLGKVLSSTRKDKWGRERERKHG
jgi:hypothetical protein